MSTIDQRQRNIAVMNLITKSVEAHRRGDAAAAGEAMAEAVRIDPAVVSALTGGMLIGKVPDPEHMPDEWAKYVQANRDGLAAAESAGEDTPSNG